MPDRGTVARATVGVMGSSRDEHEALARPLGELLARLEVNLLTGAGRGVMTSVSRAYLEARTGAGISIGIVPSAGAEARHAPREGSPNPHVELPIFTHLPLSGVSGQDDRSRNHINVLSSNVIIALPGSDGTASEVELALRYGRPVTAFARSEADVANLNARISRCFAISDVEVFISRHLGA